MEAFSYNLKARVPRKEIVKKNFDISTKNKISKLPALLNELLIEGNIIINFYLFIYIIN